MRHARILLAAAILAGWLPGALAQESAIASDGTLVLRGTLGPDQPTAAATTATPSASATDTTVAVADDAVAAGPVTRQTTIDSAAPVDDTNTASTRRTTAEGDPYAALGIRAGGFIFYPSLTLTTGYTTNAAGVAGSGGSAYGALAGELALRSDWAQNELSVIMRGADEKFFDGTTADQPTASLQATGRIDVTPDWSVALAGGYSYETQSLSDPNFPAGVDTPPGVDGLNASVEVDRHGGPALVQLESEVLRTIYENGTSGGSVVDQGDRTNTVVGTRLRVGYEVGGSVTPFVEAELRRRFYDQRVDDQGIMRSGSIQAYRAGLMVDRGPVLSGEIAAGYQRADFDDPTLAPLSAFDIDGSLVWSPSRLTRITFASATTIEASTDPASSGSVVHDNSIDLAYDWRRNVTFDGTLGVRNERFQGTGQIDTDYRAGLAITWKANRWFYLTGGYQHEWLVSTVAGRGYQSDAIRIEARLQR